MQYLALTLHITELLYYTIILAQIPEIGVCTF